jgi:hypothetical protein
VVQIKTSKGRKWRFFSSAMILSSARRHHHHPTAHTIVATSARNSTAACLAHPRLAPTDPRQVISVCCRCPRCTLVKTQILPGSVVSLWGKMYRGLSSDEGPDDVFENDSGKKNHYVTL